MRTYMLGTRNDVALNTSHAGTIRSAWTPAELANITGWYDAADISTLVESGGLVSQWNDRSGNANHLTQATSACQPLTNSRTLNGRNVVDFDGIDDCMAVNFVGALSQPNTVICVAVCDRDTDTTMLLYDGDNGTQRHQQASASAGFYSINAGSVRYGLVVRDTVPHVFMGLYNLTASTQYIDGTQTLPPGDAGSQDLGGITLGARFDCALNLEGAIAETIVIDSLVDTATQQKLEGYLAHKWGLAASLPSNHPYRYQAPTA